MDIWNPEFCLESGILSWNPESRPEFGGIPNPVQDSWVVSDPSVETSKHSEGRYSSVVMILYTCRNLSVVVHCTQNDKYRIITTLE